MMISSSGRPVFPPSLIQTPPQTPAFTEGDGIFTAMDAKDKVRKQKQAAGRDVGTTVEAERIQARFGGWGHDGVTTPWNSAVLRLPRIPAVRAIKPRLKPGGYRS